jgi:hypothetical protein
MNAEHALIEAYREWHRLAETEGEAIRTGNWGLCAASQKALQHLRERITALLPGLRAEWSQPGCNRAAKQQSLNETLHELIRLERCNHTLLNAVREVAQTKLAQLSQAGRNLQRLKQSYHLTQPPALSLFS